VSDRRYQINAGEVASKILDGEAIVINLNDGVYYSLEGTGAVVWALASSGSDVEEIVVELRERYDAPDGARDDVERLLEQLVAERLLQPGAADRAAPPVPGELPPGGEYAAPKLERYTDMSEMLALDPPLPGIRDIPWQAPEGGEPT